MRSAIQVLLFLSIIFTSVFAHGETENWYDKVDLGMDFRYRHEMQDAEEKTEHPRHRQRIRARLKVKGDVDKDVSLHLRLATGSSTERKTIASNNETLGDGSSDDPFWVDRAYAQWKPADSMSLQLGKFGVPFYKPAKSQLVWDSDLTPEGLAFQYNCQCDSMGWFFNGSAFWLDEGSSANDTADHGGLGAQVGAQFSVGDPKVVLALGHYSFPNLKDGETLDGGSSGNGNTTYTQSTEKYLYDYQLLEAIAEVQMKIAGFSSSVFAQYVQNQDPSSDNAAYMAGIRLGKVKNKQDWMFTYSYRDVEKDAVIAQLADSDFSDGQTDVKGHTAALAYGLFKNSKLALTYFMAERSVSTSKKSYDRAHLDFSFKF